MKAISLFTLVLVLSACSAAVQGDTASDATSRPTTTVEVPTTSEPTVRAAGRARFPQFLNLMRCLVPLLTPSRWSRLLLRSLWLAKCRPDSFRQCWLTLWRAPAPPNPTLRLFGLSRWSGMTARSGARNRESCTPRPSSRAIGWSSNMGRTSMTTGRPIPATSFSVPHPRHLDHPARSHHERGAGLLAPLLC